MKTNLNAIMMAIDRFVTREGTTGKRALRLFLICAGMILLSAFLVVHQPYAQPTASKYWVGESGSWFNPNNWSLTPGGPGGDGIPLSQESVFLIQSDAINRVVSYDVNTQEPSPYWEMFIDSTGTGTMTLSLSQGRISVFAQPLYIGYDGIGILNVTGGLGGGASTYLGYNSTGNGTVNLTGGSFAAVDLYVGYNGTGTINQTGGECGTEGMGVFSQGTYNLGGIGSLRVFSEFIYGTFNQTGGTHHTSMMVELSGTYNWSGGEPPNYIVVAQGGNFNLSGDGTRTINYVDNSGTVKATDTTFSCAQNFSNDGAYFSNLSANYFNNLLIGETGYLVAEEGDRFYVSGDFVNHSTMNTKWETLAQGYLEFITGEDTEHHFYLNGVDHGAILDGYYDNFAWGTLGLGSGNSLYLHDGNANPGGGLYVRKMLGVTFIGNLVTNILGENGLNIYYLASLPNNKYLGGLTYNLTGGGNLIPYWGPDPIPELVAIDIEPWFTPNIIDWKFKWAPIPVAILSKTDFDATKLIKRDSLTFGHDGDENSLAFCSPISVDVNGDKSRDLICFFYMGKTGLQCGDNQGLLRGKTKDGTLIEGSDSVKIVPCR